MWTWNSFNSKMLFYLLVCLLTCLQISGDHVDVINSTGLASLDWGDYINNVGNNSALIHIRGKRIAMLGNQYQKKKSFQTCIAPGNKKGHCRYLSNCVLEDFRTNFARYLDYMCIIEHSSVGVCCPDNAKEDVQKHSLSAENLIGSFPAIADIDDDDKPIWDAAEPDKEIATKIDLSEDSSSTPTRIGRAPRGCGMSTKSRTRIVGGRPADPREWPWMVALIRPKLSQYCGGVLITDRHVLTAAHCFAGVNEKTVVVRLGEYDFSKGDETRALDFHIVDLRVHPDFDGGNYDNDIAIIKIHRPTIFNTYIWPICLPPVGMSIENKSAIVTGWGTQYWGGPASTILMEVPVPVWPLEKCQNSMAQRISDSVICAGAYQGGRDSCQGDSGGPLVHQLANGRWVNIGIVSWGKYCGEPGNPGIYTRVNSYLDWIFENAVF